MVMQKDLPSVNSGYSHHPRKGKSVRHFNILMCRGVRIAHFKSALYISSIVATLLGIIAWLGQL